MHVTYYYDVCSMWCALGDGALAQIRERHGDRLTVETRIALINDGKPMDATPEQEAWWYERCRATTGVAFNPAWYDRQGLTTVEPHLAIEAARALGASDGAVRAALADAGMREGKRIAERAVALAVVAHAAGLAEAALATKMDDPAIRARIDETTAAFHALGIDQRPTFVLESTIGDRAIVSGVWHAKPLLATVDAMIADEDAYEAYARTGPAFPE